MVKKDLILKKTQNLNEDHNNVISFILYDDSFI
jgi:hypothetical protein